METITENPEAPQPDRKPIAEECLEGHASQRRDYREYTIEHLYDRVASLEADVDIYRIIAFEAVHRCAPSLPDFMNVFEECRASSWDGWRAILARITPEVREAWFVVGRGAGKPRMDGLIAAAVACREYRRRHRGKTSTSACLHQIENKPVLRSATSSACCSPCPRWPR